MSNTIITTAPSNNTRLPDFKILQEACKLSILEDKPIMMDYWVGSINKTVLIGSNTEVIDGTEHTEKILVRNEEEYTSPIIKVFGSGSEFILMTENSLYIVDSKIPVKRFIR
jgi:hypothetical protein